MVTRELEKRRGGNFWARPDEGRQGIRFSLHEMIQEEAGTWGGKKSSFDLWKKVHQRKGKSERVDPVSIVSSECCREEFRERPMANLDQGGKKGWKKHDGARL